MLSAIASGRRGRPRDCGFAAGMDPPQAVHVVEEHHQALSWWVRAALEASPAQVRASSSTAAAEAAAAADDGAAVPPPEIFRISLSTKKAGFLKRF